MQPSDTLKTLCLLLALANEAAGRRCRCLAASIVLSSPRSGIRRPGARRLAVNEPKPDIAEMPFETALAELEGIVDQLEKGVVSLDDSIKLYERGEALKSHCDALLKNAEMRIEKITLTAAGKPKGVVPLDGD
jgi:exodeoxyribonuclease VII small subunit